MAIFGVDYIPMLEWDGFTRRVDGLGAYPAT
jgi:hypothetical protein